MITPIFPVMRVEVEAGLAVGGPLQHARLAEADVLAGRLRKRQ
jgi:hypothetical protein